MEERSRALWAIDAEAMMEPATRELMEVAYEAGRASSPAVAVRRRVRAPSLRRVSAEAEAVLRTAFLVRGPWEAHGMPAIEVRRRVRRRARTSALWDVAVRRTDGKGKDVVEWDWAVDGRGVDALRGKGLLERSAPVYGLPVLVPTAAAERTMSRGPGGRGTRDDPRRAVGEVVLADLDGNMREALTAMLSDEPGRPLRIHRQVTVARPDPRATVTRVGRSGIDLDWASLEAMVGYGLIDRRKVTCWFDDAVMGVETVFGATERGRRMLRDGRIDGSTPAEPLDVEGSDQTAETMDDLTRVLGRVGRSDIGPGRGLARLRARLLAEGGGDGGEATP